MWRKVVSWRSDSRQLTTLRHTRLKSVIKMASLVTLPRTRASGLPSPDQRALKILSVVKWLAASSGRKQSSEVFYKHYIRISAINLRVENPPAIRRNADRIH